MDDFNYTEDFYEKEKIENNEFTLCNNFGVQLFKSNSSQVLDEDTGLADELCSHRIIKPTAYVDADVIVELEKEHKEEIETLKRLSSVLKNYCNYKEEEILALTQVEFDSLISSARFNGEQIEEMNKSTQKVKKLLHDKSKGGFYQCV